VDYTLEACNKQFIVSTGLEGELVPKDHDNIRMTLNNRLDTAAAAIVTRIITFNKPRVLWPELPFRRTSTGDSAITARDKRKNEIRWGLV
jgi:hypothetical protein